MKKIMTFVLALAVFAMSSLGAFAAEYAEVKVDGEVLEFDVPAQIIEGRTMVPMRKIFETFGAKVNWVEEEEMIIANTESGKIAVMKIGFPSLFIKYENEEEFKKVEFDVAPMIIDDRTLVPVRVVSESFGYDVEWDEETSTVLINR